MFSCSTSILGTAGTGTIPICEVRVYTIGPGSFHLWMKQTGLWHNYCGQMLVEVDEVEVD